MMNSLKPELNPLSESDVELLSSYLDNQLSVAERLRLERRLAEDARLRAELEDLRATTVALRALEPVRPPRSFALDPATAPRRAFSLPLAWFMQLGSGLAGLALVLLATVQIFAGSSLPMAASSAPPQAAFESAPMQAPAATEAAAAMAAPTAAAAAEMRQQAATEAPSATSAPGAEMAMATAAATAPKEPGVGEAGESSSAPAGGVAGGPTSNSSAGSTDPMAPPAMDSSESSAADTVGSGQEPAPSLPAAAPVAPTAGAPWLMLAAGAALIALGVGWNIAARRR
jgi:hypothetical protein